MTKSDGLPCKKCGTSKWRNTGHCVECAKESSRRWHERNPNAQKEQNRRYYHENLEAERERNRQRQRENPEAEKERGRRRRQENPEASRKSSRRWYHANSETAKRNTRRWRQANPEAVREYKRRWYHANSEAEKERGRRWRQANPEVTTASKHRRQTLKTKAGGSFTAAEWKACKEHYSNKCLCCGRDDVKLTADHVIPVSKGGTSNIDNIQPLCGPCNARKYDRTTDYRPDHGLGRWVQRKLFG